uniref:Iodothyronine deiodinase n=1 Tax=Rhizochromulina marina TaxID=1034831 RepID=A0A7S2RTH7_9STRA|mmetsp:Transcript_20741/g.60613  ORF Transcript_20741/g.60613 Transcript_20741/m.60613 type:complete len:130 (+) Transcript_20741:391-780(+)
MGHLRAFLSQMQGLHGEVDYVLVYIEEAHPVEGWLYGSVEHMIHQHKTLQDRIAAAQVLVDQVAALQGGEEKRTSRVFVDDMDNAVSMAFGALPERLAVVSHGVVQWIGGKGPEEYSVDDLMQQLTAQR